MHNIIFAFNALFGPFSANYKHAKKRFIMMSNPKTT